MQQKVNIFLFDRLMLLESRQKEKNVELWILSEFVVGNYKLFILNT
jgi:hypothetical protein